MNSKKLEGFKVASNEDLLREARANLNKLLELELPEYVLEVPNANHGKQAA